MALRRTVRYLRQSVIVSALSALQVGPSEMSHPAGFAPFWYPKPPPARLAVYGPESLVRSRHVPIDGPCRAVLGDCRPPTPALGDCDPPTPALGDCRPEAAAQCAVFTGVPVVGALQVVSWSPFNGHNNPFERHNSTLCCCPSFQERNHSDAYCRRRVDC